MNEPKFKVEFKKKEGTYGKFEIGPLAKGYGHTLGSALRRVLLSSLKGAAVTSIRINGVRHQYATFPGLKEDILEFILNIKKIRLKFYGDKPVKMKLNVGKKGDIKAGDIEAPNEVEIVNKDLYLGSFMGGKKALDVEMTVESGFGYQLGSEKNIETIGVIPVDGIFSPVHKVNYKVEATRVGRLTNLDKLIIEIWTDGTIDPDKALKKAAEILISYFSQVYEPKEFEEEPEKEKGEIPENILKMSIEELDLPMRITNSLTKGGIKTVGQLLEIRREDLFKIKNIGEKSVKNIEKKLKEKEVKLKS